MVYCGKPSESCGSCRKRRIKVRSNSLNRPYSPRLHPLRIGSFSTNEISAFSKRKKNVCPATSKACSLPNSVINDNLVALSALTSQSPVPVTVTASIFAFGMKLSRWLERFNVSKRMQLLWIEKGIYAKNVPRSLHRKTASLSGMLLSLSFHFGINHHSRRFSCLSAVLIG